MHTIAERIDLLFWILTFVGVLSLISTIMVIYLVVQDKAKSNSEASELGIHDEDRRHYR